MRRRGSRGFVIVAVLVAGLGGIWIATSLLFVASADTRLAVVSRSAVQQRSRAVSAGPRRAGGSHPSGAPHAPGLRCRATNRRN